MATKANKAVKSAKDETTVTREMLVTKAEGLGVTVPKSWSKAKIEEAIADAKSVKAPKATTTRSPKRGEY